MSNFFTISYCCVLNAKSPAQDQDRWIATGNLYLYTLSYSFRDKGSHSTYNFTIISCNILLIASLSENSSRICLIKFSHQISHIPIAQKPELQTFFIYLTESMFHAKSVAVAQTLFVAFNTCGLPI